jgi:NADPH-dependent 2,4-dienoyl-CoA reductase/sulfur reductase-like enzyme
MSGALADRILIVGAGQAGARAAEALRATGHTGDITLLGEEPHIPYERPQLSKEILLKQGAVVHIKDEAYWQTLSVNLHIGAKAVECDIEGREMRLADGRVLPYDRLLLTTGTTARRLPKLEVGGIPIHYLRTIEDAFALKRALVPSAKLVIVGGGVIGLEAAAAATVAGCTVTVIETATSLLSRALPKAASEFLLRRHRAAGVNFIFESSPERIEDGLLILTNGKRVDADLILVGIGAEPLTHLAQQMGLDATLGIKIDAFGQTEAPDVFAAGDVALQRDQLRNRWVRVETWANAQNQAIAVAKNMAGQRTEYNDPAWFWTDQYDTNLQVVGDMGFGDLVVRGDPQSDKFTLLALDEQIVRGAVTVNRRPEMAALRRLVALGKPADRASLENPSFDLRKALVSQ